MRKWLLLATAILLEVTATLSLRGALDHPAFYVLVALGYVGSLTVLALVLRAGLALEVAYGIWGASGVALTAILAALFFGDPLTGVMGIGIALVIGGVLCVELGAQSARSAPPAQSAPSPRSRDEGAPS
ncbi:DMT family transporter [Streptomyces seoulensis]|uniref:DMT family transporter n=1 Tax=Streptomyces seoulensis TaxID=73044 RepID=UPI0036CBFD1E